MPFFAKNRTIADDKMKKSYIIIAVLALVLVLCLAGFFLRGEISEGVHHLTSGTTAPPPVESDADDYVGAVKGSVDNAEPLLKSTIDDLYFTVSRSGEVAFFRVNGTTIEQVPETGAYDVTVKCTEQKIPATVHYYTDENGKTAGYGLFTTENSDAEVYIYDYAFFCLMDLPEAYADSHSYLLLVDTTKEDFYTAEKVYEENFTYSVDDGSAEPILSNDNRAFDETGAFRADYAMLTEDAVKLCGEHFLFFSSRQYHLFTKDHNMDLYMAGGSGNNRDNNRYIQDLVDFYYRFDEQGRVVCLKRTEAGFSVIAYDGETETVMKEFSGDFAENYLRCGDWLLNRQTLELTNILSGETKNLKVTNANQFVPDLFALNGSHVFLRGVSEGKAVIALGDVETGCRTYYNDSFSGIFAPIALPDGNILVNTALDAEGSRYSVKIFDSTYTPEAK